MKYARLIVLFFFYTVAFDASLADQQNNVSNDELRVWIEEKNVDGKKTRVLKTNKKVTSEVEQSSVDDKSLLCEVDVSTDYWQANENVKVEAYIETPDCVAAHGSYRVSVRTKNEAGEYNTKIYPEEWSRDNAEPVKFIHSYSMNGDSDLVKVRIKMIANDSCVCGLRDSAGSE